MNESENGAPQDDKEQNIQQLPPPIEGGSQTVNGPTDGNHADQKKINLPQRIEAVCAVLLVIITAAYTYYAAGQLHKMRRSVEAAEGANRIASRSLVETNRSWIEIRLSDKDKPRTVEKTLSDLKSLAIPLVFTNIGRFPVKNVVLAGSVELVKSDEAVSFHPAAPHFKSPHSRMGLNILFPTRGNDFMAAAFQETKEMSEVRHLTATDKRALRGGSEYLMVFARGTFDDGFGKHWVESCEPIFFGGRGGRYGDCINYNDAGDRDMPKD
jgi:hypothetical protein